MGHDEIILNKIAIIERCIQRVREEYEDNSKNLENLTKQDSIILNIQRACEASIDLAMHVVAEKKLGLPQTSLDAFELLHTNHLIDLSLTNRLKTMIGFRNIAVHDYQGINFAIVQQIIEKHLNDFRELAKVMISI